MDLSELDQANPSSPETFSESYDSPDSPDTSGIYGEPLVHPRVGDEYQVEIPPVLCDYDSEGIFDSSRSFLMGLQIPVIWVRNQSNANPIRDERMESLHNPQASSTNGLEKTASDHISPYNKEPNVEVHAPNKTSARNGYCLAPGLPTDSWGVFEADCFLLGLYIFGKNLLQVKRFMESKDVGQILSFYYGQFYGSAGYRRWSECRKMRNRKSLLGHKFFTGYRQQELVSRLLPCVSEDSKTKLLEASRAFTDGRAALEGYVSTLKSLVGINALVEAVGIGKGKKDLTALHIDSSKNNQLLGHRPEIPSGKACSSLTCADVVKYLTGDFRLSKARSNDLFWEAIWPRLLARGWHSEQPRGDGYTGSQNCLVFLTPGIKKFSRRKLSKGDHYFNSVSDVLAKVASEPELLELEADETRPSNSKEENGWLVEGNSDNGQDSSDNERHRYLKPRVSTGLSNLMKFTIVDTSLANEDNPFKVRELRSLPLEATRSPFPNGVQSLTFPAHSKGLSSVIDGSQRTHGNNPDHRKMQGDAKLTTDHKSRAIKHQFSRRIKPGLSSCSGPVTKRRKLSSYVEADVTCVLSLPARGRNAAFRVKTKNVIPSKVRLSLVKGSCKDTTVSGFSEEKNLSNNVKANLVGSDAFRENEKKPEVIKGIDLNLPQFPTETESDAKVKVKVAENNAKQHSDAASLGLWGPESDGKVKVVGGKNNADRHSCVEKLKHSDDGLGPCELKSDANVKLKSNENNANQYSNAEKVENSDAKEPLLSYAATKPSNKDGGGCEQQPRRQSTRNRPLTTKALEALEIGFLNPVRHSRKRSPSTTRDQKSKSSHQPRSKSPVFPNVVDLKVGEADGTCKVKVDAPGNHLIGRVPTQKEARENLGLSEASCPEAS